jgi:hypothetical protein
MNKICGVCKKDKQLFEFNTNVAKKDGYQTSCRECRSEYNRKHYKKNKIDYLKSANKARKKYRDKILDLISKLKDKPCADCDVKYIKEVMEFDHLDSKIKIDSISNMISWGRSEEDILREVAKCDLVCANCHRIRTVNRRKNNGSRSGITENSKSF